MATAVADSDVAVDPEALARDHLGFARSVASRYARKFPALADEFESAAHLALAQAVRSFDPGRGFKFSSHLGPRLRGACKDVIRESAPKGLRKRGARGPWTSIIPFSALDSEGQMDVGNPLDAAAALPSGEDAVGWEAESEDTVRALLRPFGRNGQVVARIYLGASGGGEQVVAAREFGLSPSMVSKIRSDVLAAIKETAVLDPKGDRFKGKISAIAAERKRLGRAPTREEIEVLLDRYDAALNPAPAAEQEPDPMPAPTPAATADGRPADDPTKPHCLACGKAKTRLAEGRYRCYRCQPAGVVAPRHEPAAAVAKPAAPEPAEAKPAASECFTCGHPKTHLRDGIYRCFKCKPSKPKEKPIPAPEPEPDAIVFPVGGNPADGCVSVGEPREIEVGERPRRKAVPAAAPVVANRHKHPYICWPSTPPPAAESLDDLAEDLKAQQQLVELLRDYHPDRRARALAWVVRHCVGGE